MFSTLGGYHEYIGGDIMSTSGGGGGGRGHHEYIGGYHEYIGVCSVHQGFQYKSKAFITYSPT